MRGSGPVKEADEAGLEDEYDANPENPLVDSLGSNQCRYARSNINVVPWDFLDVPCVEPSKVVGHQRKTETRSLNVFRRPLIQRRILLSNVLQGNDLLHQPTTSTLSPPQLEDNDGRFPNRHRSLAEKSIMQRISNLMALAGIMKFFLKLGA